MKHILLACCIVALFFSCASAPTVRNSIAPEASFEQKLFSSSDYISVHGYGQDAVSAEHNALVGLSRYFSSRISVNTTEKTLVTDNGSKSRLEDMTHIVSDTTLFAVQEILADLGFSVTADQQAARYVCALDLMENKKELPAGIFFTPSIGITIFENQQMPLFSYSKTLNRIGASSESAAKQRMFHARHN